MSNVATIRQRGADSDIQWTLVALAVWFFIAVALGTSGALTGNGQPPIGIGLAIALPVILFVVDRRFGGHVLGGLARLELPALIAAQTFRVGGVFFLIAWWGGTLPGGFALSAGLGDIAVGLAAPFIAAAVAARRPHHLALARIWNVLGTLDLVTAVSLGVLHARSPIGLLAGPVTTDVMARYPLSLIPTFAVPLALMLHISTYRRLGTGAV